MAITMPGKPAPEPRSTQRRALRREGEKLGAVGDMAGPDLGEARLGDEIGDLSPSAEKVDVEREPRFGFRRHGNEGEGAGAIALIARLFHVKQGQPVVRRFAPPCPASGRRTAASPGRAATSWGRGEGSRIARSARASAGRGRRSGRAAAGVAPSMRPAWPRLAGRAAMNFGLAARWRGRRARHSRSRRELASASLRR